LKPGRMGSWDLRGQVTLLRNDQTEQKIQFPSQLLTLLNDRLESSADLSVLSRLNSEIDDSFVNDTLCLAFHQQWTLK
ncbi:hypothetical protein U8M77_28195, partial [Klebsiella pneumoniae]|nr:hypothetical protein [Klebsiella pneumoniae]